MGGKKKGEGGTHHKEGERKTSDLMGKKNYLTFTSIGGGGGGGGGGGKGSSFKAKRTSYVRKAGSLYCVFSVKKEFKGSHQRRKRVPERSHQAWVHEEEVTPKEKPQL